MSIKMKFETPDLTAANVAKIAALFPGVVAEGKVNIDLLRTMLGDDVHGDEAYEFTWVGKRAAIAEAGRPINKTLRPVVDDETLPAGADSQGEPYCSSGSRDWDTTENLYIEGDNLDVLKLLQESYLGKVKMIYIDPPYNTGNDFVYRDNFAVNRADYEADLGVFDEEGGKLFKNTDTNGRFHSDWCSMMYPRLVLARNILAPNGVIVISIDEKEVHNLRKICDEVFGASNYAGEIVWKNSSKNDEAYITIQHEYILFYTKNKAVNSGSWQEAKDGVDEIVKAFDGFKKQYGNEWSAIHQAALVWYRQFPESNPIYDSKHYNWMDDKGVYFASDISGPNFGQYRYNVVHPVTGKVVKEPASGWRYPEGTMLERIKQGLVHFGENETTIPKNKTYLADTVNQSLTSIKYKDGRVATKQLTTLMGANCFTNPKDVSLLVRIMKAINIAEDDIIMDFFAGSSATAEAVIQLCADGISCSFVLVQIQEDLDKALKYATGSAKQVTQNAINLCDAMGVPHLLTEIGKERIRRAGDKIKAEAGLTAQNLDIGFRVLKLDDTNMKDIYYAAGDYTQDIVALHESNIKPDRTDMDLLFACLLDWGLLLSLPHTQEQIDGFTVHTYNGGDLVACFEAGISENAVREIASREIADRQPRRVVFRDSGFGSSPEKINVFEIFKLLAPNTTVRVI